LLTTCLNKNHSPHIGFRLAGRTVPMDVTTCGVSGMVIAMTELIEHIDGVDTVALQGSCPELFTVTARRDGMTRWTLRPEVCAVLRRISRTVQ